MVSVEVTAFEGLEISTLVVMVTEGSTIVVNVVAVVVGTSEGVGESCSPGFGC